jgi:hypothetical protein
VHEYDCRARPPEHAPAERSAQPHLTHLTHLSSSAAEDGNERRGLCNHRPSAEATRSIFSLRLWRRAGVPADAERRALEDWVCLRFQLAAPDPMIAIIGAMGRLADTGMTTDEAIDTVLRIVRELQSLARPDPGQR